MPLSTFHTVCYCRRWIPVISPATAAFRARALKELSEDAPLALVRITCAANKRFSLFQCLVFQTTTLN